MHRIRVDLAAVFESTIHNYGKNHYCTQGTHPCVTTVGDKSTSSSPSKMPFGLALLLLTEGLVVDPGAARPDRRAVCAAGLLATTGIGPPHAAQVSPNSLPTSALTHKPRQEELRRLAHCVGDPRWIALRNRSALSAPHRHPIAAASSGPSPSPTASQSSGSSRLSCAFASRPF